MTDDEFDCVEQQYADPAWMSGDLDNELMAYTARHDIAKLFAEVHRLQAENAELRDLLGPFAWRFSAHQKRDCGAYIGRLGPDGLPAKEPCTCGLYELLERADKALEVSHESD
jgi:hypothetical protein